MSYNPNVLGRLSLTELMALKEKAEASGDRKLLNQIIDANDKVTQTQTEELSRSGKLYCHRNYDPYNGRITHNYTGDCKAAFAPFITPGMTLKVNKDVGTKSVETRIGSGQSLQVVNADGSVARQIK